MKWSQYFKDARHEISANDIEVLHPSIITTRNYQRIFMLQIINGFVTPIPMPLKWFNSFVKVYGVTSVTCVYLPNLTMLVVLAFDASLEFKGKQETYAEIINEWLRYLTT